VQRITDMKTPPVVGETYLVPVMTERDGRKFPVMGVPHRDPELGNDWEHQHIDVRFVTDKDMSHNFWWHWRETQEKQCGFYAFNLDQSRDGGGTCVPVEEPLVCVRETFIQHADCKAETDTNRFMRTFAQEKKAEGFRLNPACKVCPHRGTRLDNVKPVDGLILCPAHGMAFDEKEGTVVS
jgi:hypothetical protein